MKEGESRAPLPSPENLEAARRIVTSKLVEQHLEELVVSEDRLQDVAQWLERGWGVEVYYAEPEWLEDGVGDDITYGGLVIKPIFPEENSFIG